MRSKSGFTAFLFKLLVLSLGTFFTILSGVFLRHLLHAFDWTGFFGLLFFVAFSATALFLFFGLVSSLRTDDARKIIEVKRGWFFSESYRFIDMVGCKGFNVTSQYGSYRGFLIELITGAQIQFTELDFSNFTDVRTFILSRLKRENSLKRSKYPLRINSCFVRWQAAEIQLTVALKPKVLIPNAYLFGK